jgi:hypothetical protein
MDEETRKAFAAQEEKLAAPEERIKALQAQLDAMNPPKGEFICLEEAAHRRGMTYETMRRKAAAFGGRKVGGRWQFPA